jgi:hypothetical protein
VRLFSVTEGFTAGGGLVGFYPDERAEHDQLLTSARASLGDEAYSAAREACRQMNPDEAVAFALKQL